MTNEFIGRSAQWQSVERSSIESPNTGRRAPGQSVGDYLASARSARVGDVAINAQINRDYLRYGKQIQRSLFADFRFKEQLGPFIPNWFPIAFHVSSTVGDSMMGALAGLELLIEMRTGRLVPPDAILTRLGARAERVGWLRRLSGFWFNLLDIPHDVGSVILAALRMNYGVIWKPHVLLMSIRRMKALLNLASGETSRSRAEYVLRNTVEMLGAGNQAVYADIAPAFETFLAWQALHPNASGPDMIEAIPFDGDKRLARELFELARTSAELPYPIQKFAESAPMQEGRILLLASGALYQHASQEPDPEAKRTAIRSANALLALREQRDLLQPAFDSEHGGREIFETLTPMLRVHFGRVVWNYSSFQSNPLVGNWGLFEERWPAIMDAFENLYQHCDAAWDLPGVYAREILDP
ncbi:MAG: hypothetical protein EOO70_03215 [Myxococcaceae bacterium]|nr:MAG: hypothetical protein EOO70_03215 [Myxococcaceae bacterium]